MVLQYGSRHMSHCTCSTILKHTCSMGSWSTTFLICHDYSPLSCPQHTSIVSHRWLLPGLLNNNLMCVQADGAVLRATRDLQEVIADQEEQIRRLKHDAANSRPAVQQISEAFRLLHAMKIEHSADSCSIAALSREARSLPLQAFLLGSR